MPATQAPTPILDRTETLAWTQPYDQAEPQRVNRWLAQNGVCSRREAEALIAKGLVWIDGERVDDPGRKIGAGQTLVLTDDAQARLGAGLSLMIHKPVGVVSSQPEGRQVPAVRLLTLEAMWREEPSAAPAAAAPDRDSRLAPAGRLDMDSRGLLILSQDGVLAKAVIGPESRLDKEYIVGVAGVVTARRLGLLRHGLSLDGRTLKPAKVDQIDDRQLRFVLNEGRNRQIRRMCEAVDLRVVDLLRVRIGPLHLGALPQGRWRPVTPGERAALIDQA